MKFPSKVMGCIQGAGIVLYVTFFALFIQYMGQSFGARAPIGPALSIMTFLLLFIISALICGGIVFGYPLVLFFDGKGKDALKIVLWTIIWLVTFALIFGCVELSFLIRH